MIMYIIYITYQEILLDLFYHYLFFAASCESDLWEAGHLCLTIQELSCEENRNWTLK